MSVRMEPNGPGDDVDLDVTIEEDDGIFLSVAAYDVASASQVCDFITTSPEEIEAFFDMVSDARTEWEKRK